MRHLEVLAYAIMQAEGFFAGSRSWRNNNPGNLRFSKEELGSDDNFSIFQTFTDGFNAMWQDLWLKCTGKTSTGLNGQSTIEDLVKKWIGPASQAETNTYLETVCRVTGCPANKEISFFLSDMP